MEAQGESGAGVLNLVNTGAQQVVDVTTSVRGDSSFSRQLHLFNFGPDAIEVAYGNGDVGAFVPVLANQSFGTGGPITKFVARAAPASMGAKVSYDLKIAGGK